MSTIHLIATAERLTLSTFLKTVKFFVQPDGLIIPTKRLSELNFRLRQRLKETLT